MSTFTCWRRRYWLRTRAFGRRTGASRWLPRKSAVHSSRTDAPSRRGQLMSNDSDAKRKPLRSTQWFGRHDRDALVHRSWMKNQGIPHDQFDGRPVIGICNTWSEATPCNAHFRDLAEHVRRGVLDAGGFPIEFPVMSLGETLMRPTTMLFRNQ